MNKTIILEGTLGKQFGIEHSFDVKNPREAVRALRQYPGFDNAFRIGHYRVSYEINSKRIDLDESSIDITSEQADKIIFTPVISGSEDVVKVVAGVAFVFLAGPAALALGFSGTAAVAVTTAIRAVGYAVALNGVANLLAPTPTSPTLGNTNADDPEYILSGPTNSVEQGGAVPIVFGKARVGSLVVSSSVESETFAETHSPYVAPRPPARPSPPPPNNDTSNGGGRGGHNNGRGGDNGNNNGGTQGRGDANASGGTA